MKKVTLQDIANALGISRTTVWKVFGKQDGVSDSLREKVVEKAREIGYKLPAGFDDTVPAAEETAPLNIAVAVCRPETSLFWMEIIHQIAKELSKNNANLIYTYLPTTMPEHYTLPEQLTNGSIHGMIIMNVYDTRLIHCLAEANMPKVFLDTAADIASEELNGDLILMENRLSILKITEHLISRGCKKIGFLGDIGYALSNKERYEGFLEAVRRHHLELNSDFIYTETIDIDHYQETVEQFLNGLTSMPDAFVCTNDHVACILLEALTDRGCHVPENVAISGFDGNAENPLEKNLTTVFVFNRLIGMRLAMQILARIHHPQMRYETIYLSTEVEFRESTEWKKG